MSDREDADYAFNLSRVLRRELEGLTRPQPVVETPAGDERKRLLHAWLDRIQSLTPEFLRATVRPLYLNLFYRRVFPPARPAAAVMAAPVMREGSRAWSGYAPFLAFKEQLCRDLNMDMAGFGIRCRKGLVSVVLPVYNGERYVSQSIESVLRQTFTEFELIVVDDGSTDETPARLARYAGEPRVKVIRQDNQKLPAALNTGFASATGEFFTWTSADNLMKPQMLARLVNFLNANATVEMVYADEELIGESDEPALHANFCEIYQTPPGSNLLRRPRDPGELNFVQNNFVGACFLYRAWAGRIVGDYDSDCFGFEDYDYWLRMNALFRIAHSGDPDILYSYRLHRGSLTSRERELRIADRARYALPLEAERRRFFASNFDITFIGHHPWFPELARAYRRSGHNVFEMRDQTEEELYRYRVSRAFEEKSIVISTAVTSFGAFALFEGYRVTAAGREWHAEHPYQIEYPLLALANRVLWCATQPGGCVAVPTREG